MLFCRFNFLDMKAIKELYGKKRKKEDRRPRYLLYLAFISGFKYHSVGGKFFLNTTEMVASPSQGVKMCQSFSGIYVQIWCSRH